eukprot:1314-Amorphochlora_amoeboformis.AAC.1
MVVCFVYREESYVKTNIYNSARTWKQTAFARRNRRQEGKKNKAERLCVVVDIRKGGLCSVIVACGAQISNHPLNVSCAKRIHGLKWSSTTQVSCIACILQKETTIQ